MFEKVYTYNWFSGLLDGIADYNGCPHLFKLSETQHFADPGIDAFFLSPIDSETFRLALEKWGIWLRWLAAFNQGETTRDTHPALPEYRARYTELKDLLKARLIVDPESAFLKGADYRRKAGVPYTGGGSTPLEIRWFDVPERSVL